MYKILKKRRLSSNMTWLVIEAPLVARKAKPGQFIILRTDEYGERIPSPWRDMTPRRVR